MSVSVSMSWNAAFTEIGLSAELLFSAARSTLICSSYFIVIVDWTNKNPKIHYDTASFIYTSTNETHFTQRCQHTILFLTILLMFFAMQTMTLRANYNWTRRISDRYNT